MPLLHAAVSCLPQVHAAPLGRGRGACARRRDAHPWRRQHKCAEPLWVTMVGGIEHGHAPSTGVASLRVASLRRVRQTGCGPQRHASAHGGQEGQLRHSDAACGQRRERSRRQHLGVHPLCTRRMRCRAGENVVWDTVLHVYDVPQRGCCRATCARLTPREMAVDKAKFDAAVKVAAKG